MSFKVRSRSCILLLVIFFAFIIQCCQAFYLPGVAPEDYSDNDEVPLYVNTLTPMSNQQVKSVVSYDYYDERFHFCRPDSEPEKQPESLGSIIFGDRIFSSAFKVILSNNILQLKVYNKNK